MTEDTEEDFSPGEELSPAEWVAVWRLPWTRLTGPLPAATAPGSRCDEDLTFYLLRTLKPSLTMRAPRVAAAPLSTPFVIVSW